VKTLAERKTAAKAAIAARKERLAALSQNLHAHPELAMHEHDAQRWLTEELAADGFEISKGTAGLPTAFEAACGQGNPRLAFLAEYDALPGLGHACGHNLIAAAALAAGLGAQAALDGLSGTVLVMGTPAEELEGGKILMVARGAFKKVDAALMLHPAAHDSATVKALACLALEVEFFGKEAHAAAHPDLGVNALEAMIQSFTAINALRQHVRSDARIHGIITDGGRAANIVPGHSAARFLVRTDDAGYLDELKGKALACFEGAARATGARLEHRWDDQAYFAPMRNNAVMARLYADNMASLGHPVPYYNAGQSFGSTDMGNVSQAVPAIHTSVAIAPPGTSEHTPAFARLAGGARALDLALEAATALAWTALDLLARPELMAEAKAEHGR
jgi:amidohydrolase